MDLRIIDALSSGLARLTTRDGLVLAAIFYALSALNGVLNAAILGGARSAPAPGAGVPGGPGAAPGVDPGALLPSFGTAFVVSLLFGVASAAVAIGAIRAFVTGADLSAELFTRNLPLALVNYVAGGFVYAVLVSIGFVLLVLPGIFLMVVLAFWTVYVAVEDENFVSAFAESWRLTDGNRLRLFGLGVALVVVGVVITIPFGLVSGVIGFATGGGVAGQVVGALIGQVGSAITTILALGTLAAAYDQLTPGATAEAGTGAEPDAIL